MGLISYQGKPVQRAALDSNCFIYLLEDSPFASSVVELFHHIEEGRLMAVTSSVTVTECLTGAYRSGERRVIEAYRIALLHFPNLTIVPVDARIAEKAAELRSIYSLKTPDAIQLATAMILEADVLVTNDRHFAKADFPVILLGESET